MTTCYEPKWDGFRCIVFRDGDEVELASRGEKPLTRYFPEVVEALRANLPQRCVVDGEIVIATGDRLDFEALLQRIHPAESRVDMLAEETPASFVAFDLLALDDESLLATPFARAAGPARAGPVADADAAGVPHPGDRRRRPSRSSGSRCSRAPGSTASSPSRRPAPTSPTTAAMLKIKHERTADCVVAGYRWHKSGGDRRARCCSACTTTTGACSTSGCRRPSR